MICIPQRKATYVESELRAHEKAAHDAENIQYWTWGYNAGQMNARQERMEKAFGIGFLGGVFIGAIVTWIVMSR
jgi:hypothetical protein